MAKFVSALPSNTHRTDCDVLFFWILKLEGYVVWCDLFGSRTVDAGNPVSDYDLLVLVTVQPAEPDQRHAVRGDQCGSVVNVLQGRVAL